MKEHMYGIDMLKIYAMYAIVCIHYLAHGGFLDETEVLSTVWNIAWLIYSFVQIGVDVFVIASGYFLIEENKFSWKKVFSLWGQVVFYGVSISFLLSFFMCISKWKIILSLFPIKFASYWFFPRYIALYVLSPYLGMLGRSLSKCQYQKLLLIMLSLFSVYSFYTEPFGAIGGKTTSITWFVVLFFIGGYIRRFPPKLKGNHSFVLYFASSLVLFGIQACIHMFFPLLAEKIGDRLFYINSPFIITSAVFLFLAVYSFEPQMGVSLKLWKVFGKATFGIYLIHENQHIFPWFWREVCKTEQYYNSPYFLLNFFVSTIAVYIVCVGIELLRQKMFNGIFVMSRSYD